MSDKITDGFNETATRLLESSNYKEVNEVNDDIKLLVKCFNKLQSENKALQEKLAVAVEVLEFYQDLDNFDSRGIITARHALKQIKEMDK